MRKRRSRSAGWSWVVSCTLLPRQLWIRFSNLSEMWRCAKVTRVPCEFTHLNVSALRLPNEFWDEKKRHFWSRSVWYLRTPVKIPNYVWLSSNRHYWKLETILIHHHGNMLMEEGRGTVVPVLNRVPRHEDVLVEWGVPPHILNLGTRWRWTVSFSPSGRFTLEGRATGAYWIGPWWWVPDPIWTRWRKYI